jgi:hypothetical protein
MNEPAVLNETDGRWGRFVTLMNERLSKPAMTRKTVKSPRSWRESDSVYTVLFYGDSFTPSSDPQASPVTVPLVPLIA